MLTPEQKAVLESPRTSKIFLRGPAGCGKTTCGIEWIQTLIEQSVSAESILVLTPQRSLQKPYQSSLATADLHSSRQVTMATIGGLARRMVDLFWPIVLDFGGFSLENALPTFLTLETAQYYMAQIVRPKMDEGWFESVVIDRNRLYSQILDNLNKSASIGFPHTEIGDRLASAWAGDPSQRRVYADTQACANEFRRHCLEHNLLDFSLQLEMFTRLYRDESVVRDYLHQYYRHLVYDNCEEDIPIAHDLISSWLSTQESALIIYDDEGGYRKFLGADPQSALSVATQCQKVISLQDSFITTEDFQRISNAIPGLLNSSADNSHYPSIKSDAFEVISTRFYPEMLDEVAAEIIQLSQSGIPVSQIAILTPFLSDTLRFSLTHRLEELGIAQRSLRPSRSLREEPASQCLITLAKLAHPGWGLLPKKYDVVRALLLSIDGLDLVRAQLLTEIAFRVRDASLGSFERINPEMQERISFVLGQRYEVLRTWLNSYAQGEPLPLDHFLRRMFGEVLSQPGFRFHREIDSARVAASLIESIEKFRQATSSQPEDTAATSKNYIDLLQEGVIAAQYLDDVNNEDREAVLVSPAHTFLMSNLPVQIQFWLDVGSSGWYERLFQPITHPYVLSRDWQPGRVWTDADEVTANNKTLADLITGLLRRCRERVYLCTSELGESGFEQRGILLRTFNQVLSLSNPQEDI